MNIHKYISCTYLFWLFLLAQRMSVCVQVFSISITTISKLLNSYFGTQNMKESKSLRKLRAQNLRKEGILRKLFSLT
jgi:hypothetical protein